MAEQFFPQCHMKKINGQKSSYKGAKMKPIGTLKKLLNSKAKHSFMTLKELFIFPSSSFGVTSYAAQKVKKIP